MNITRSGDRYLTIGAAVEAIPAGTSNPEVSHGAFLIGQGGVTQAESGAVSVNVNSVTWKVRVHPAELKIGLQDVDLDAGRTSDGWMKRNKKAIKRTISAELPPMTKEELSLVLKAIDPVDSGDLVAMFPVKYLDPWEGGYRTRAFYSGDRVAPMYNGVMNLWENLPLEFVEM